MFCFFVAKCCSQFFRRSRTCFPLLFHMFFFFLRIEATGSGHHNARNDQSTSSSSKKRRPARQEAWFTLFVKPTDFVSQGVQMNTDVHVLGHGPAARAHHHWRQRRRHDPVGTESLCMVRPVPLPSPDVAQLYPSLHRCTLSTQATAEILLCPPSPASSSTEASGVFSNLL